MIAEILHVINDHRRLARAEMFEAVGHKTAHLFLIDANPVVPFARFLILTEVANLRRQDLVEDHAAQRSLDRTVTIHARRNLRLQIQFMVLIR